MSPRDRQKKEAARAALGEVPKGCWLGVGTGSTTNHFIRLLPKRWVRGAVASSVATAQALKRRGIRVVPMMPARRLAVYVDGADEADSGLRLIKGGGGALTREKIVATASRRFICIADGSKLVKRLGRHPVPLEVVPMAREQVAARVRKLGGRPVWRKGFVTDNGGEILDVHGLRITDPAGLEKKLEAIPGVVCAGIFGKRKADLLLLGMPAGVRRVRAGSKTR
ncbi:MAG: ribose-5-phosphate isomerase RpiA [Verrucomicrobia bacterium]|nr:ribose-5-phosphate isomerase RpiA [Verrucomicrobiota bacterium]